MTALLDVAAELLALLPAGSRVDVSSSIAGDWIECDTPAGDVITAGAGFASCNWGVTLMHRSLDVAAARIDSGTAHQFEPESSIAGVAYYYAGAGDDDTGPAPDAAPVVVARYIVEQLAAR
jgi:hypothetical protein